MFAVALTGWYVGFALAIVAIGIVVVLVAWIMQLARQISVQTARVDEQLKLARRATAVIGEVPAVNAGLKDIAESCITARGVLEGAFG